MQHRSIEQLIDNSDTSWSISYSQHIDTINRDPADLIGQPIDNEDEDVNSDEESLDEIIEDDEPEEFRFDWMHLAEMGPNTRIINDSDLGNRDMDRNYNWTTEAQLNYSDNDITNSCVKFQQTGKTEEKEMKTTSIHKSLTKIRGEYSNE